MLLILEPFSFVTLAVSKGINAITFTFTFDVITLLDVTIFERSLTLSVRLPTEHFALIDTTISELVCSDNNILGQKRKRRHQETRQKTYYKKFIWSCAHKIYFFIAQI